MEVSGSILAVKSNYFDYAKMLKYVNVNYLHIDIFEDEAEFAIDELIKFDKTYLPLDVHLIFSNILDKHISVLNKANVKYLNVQYETLEDKDCIIRLSKKFKGNLGMAITTETPIELIEKYLDYISQVLFMCSEPGVTGAKFDDKNYERIQKVHSMYPTLKLFADGGINDVIGEKMGKLGISMVVSGSYLCKDFEQLGASAYKLKYMNEQNINVTREMIKINSLPLLTERESFTQVINIMNHYRLGIVFIVEDEKLKGIISDGDVRRAFITYGESIFKKKARDIMNKKPFVISSNSRVGDIFEKLSTMHKGIDVVPIVEIDKLVGAIDLKVGI